MRASSRSQCARLAVTLALALIAQAAPGVRPAHAHAELVSAVPAPGAQLAAPPSEIRLTFSESLRSGSWFVVFGEDFAETPGLFPTVDPQRPTELAAAAPRLAPGRYTVQWTAVTEDGHETTGSYAFGVAEADRGGLVFWSMVLVAIGLTALIVWAGTGRRRR